MGNKLYLNMKEDQVVLFADILGFSDAIKKFEYVTMCDKGGIIVNFPRVYQTYVEKYSVEKQKDLGIKLLWVSDSVIVSAPLKNVDSIFAALNDFTNNMYSSNLALRGAIAVGKLYHENNVWGPALVDAVRDEKDKANYPRIIIKKEHFDKLNVNSKYKKYIVESDVEGYYQYEFFDQYIGDIVCKKANTIAKLSVYIKFIRSQYTENDCPSVKKRYKWLAQKLLDTVNKHSSYIDEYVLKNKEFITLSGEIERLTSHIPLKLSLEEIVHNGEDFLNNKTIL